MIKRAGWSWIVVSSILVTLTSVSAEDSQDQQATPFISPQTVKSWLDEGRPVTFLDIREADEFEAGHLPGAINVPSGKVAGTAANLPKDRSLVLYCIHSAHRAPEAAKHLRTLGFDNAYVMEGGIAAWEAGGQTIQASDLTRTPKVLPLTDRCEEKEKPPS